MKFFWVSALIAFLQIILLYIMAKCINRKKAFFAFVIFALKIFCYWKIVFAFVDKYILHAIECVSGYAVGLTSGAVILYIICYFLYPLAVVPGIIFLFNKLLKVPVIRQVSAKFIDIVEGIKHRIGYKNEKGFEVKKIKF
ncbi:MAG: hypothetical protein J6J13_01475 [Clostridia bacterium]|nr:hypothetical protein [Clostridia bacterium]MBP3705908.1 hypothetical protein [Clostridia bacterium]